MGGPLLYLMHTLHMVSLAIILGHSDFEQWTHLVFAASYILQLLLSQMYDGVMDRVIVESLE